MSVGALVKDHLDRGEPDAIPQGAQLVRLGSLLAAMLKPTLVEGIVVYGHAAQTTVPGRVTSVVATAGGSTGGLLIVPSSATPGAGECKVAYDASGNATVTTAAADTVTEIDVEYVGLAASYAALQGNLIG